MIGIKIGLKGQQHILSDASVNAFLAATGITGTTQVNAITNLVANLKNYGLWSKMQAIYPFVSDTYNLFSYSEIFSNAAWTKTNISITDDTTIAPDGTLTADTIQNLGAGYMTQSNLVLNTDTYTQSIFAKKNNNDWIAIYTSDAGSNYAVAWFNINTGIKGTVTAVGTFTSATSNISADANGFYRCSITFTKPTTANTDSAVIVPDSDNTFARTIGKNAYIWGAQIQTGSLSTYQPIATTPSARFVSQFKYNLKDPRDLNVAFRLTFNGSWVYTQQGPLPNGINTYLDTFFNQQNDWISTTNGSMGIYLRTNTIGAYCDMGAGTIGTGANSSTIFSRYTGDVVYSGLNCTTVVPGSANTDSRGFHAVSRTNSTDYSRYKRGTSTINLTNTDAVGTNINRTIYLAAGHDLAVPLNYSNRQIAFSYLGNGLTQTQVDLLYTAVQSFQTELSRQV